MGTKLYQLVAAACLVSLRLSGESLPCQGRDLPSCCLLNNVIASIFSISNQTIPSGGAVIFEHENIESEPIDTMMAPHLGTIHFKQTGVYEICWHLAGIFYPDSMWSFGLSIDGQIIPLSVIRDENICHAGITLIHLITAGQELSLVNLSQNSVQLISASCGSNCPGISAMLNIKMLSRLD